MSNTRDTEGFDFFIELSKPKVYESLVLDRTLTLALALLYQRERVQHNDEGSSSALVFSEEDIRDCLKQVMPPNQREQHERYNQFIRDLQLHFLWRDEEKGTYHLKDYARAFCRLMYDRLEQKFEPTYTKRIFTQLIKSLNDVWQDVDSDPFAFNHWVDQDFENARTNISNQVEIIYSKVDETVRQLRNEISPADDNFLTTLQNADRNLEILTKDADELNHILHASAIIRGRLNELQHKPYVDSFGHRINMVSMFLSDTIDKLDLVRRRIRKIRPHIQRLFNVQQREFDLNTGKFLSYLLENSKISYRSGSKQVVFPDTIEEKPIFHQRLNFERFSKQSFTPPKPIHAKRAKVSREIRQEQLQAHQQVLERVNEVQNWLKKIQLELEEQGNVVLSEIFFQILDLEVDGTAIALTVVQRALSFYSISPQYTIVIGKVIQKPNHLQHTICETIIRQ